MEKSYLKVDNYIKEQILNGELKAGDKLPPERELAQILDVSRNSVREGLRILENMGVIASQQGSGNYISNEFDDAIVSVMSYMYVLKDLIRFGMAGDQSGGFAYYGKSEKASF